MMPLSATSYYLAVGTVDAFLRVFVLCFPGRLILSYHSTKFTAGGSLHLFPSLIIFVISLKTIARYSPSHSLSSRAWFRFVSECAFNSNTLIG
ncbi:hypothetical protein BDW67DRAFT_170279 [Aspergillus spinulosporus]